jgi:predicted transcriptional regulator
MRTEAGLPYSEPTTGRAAAESMARAAPMVRERVYAAIEATGADGCTTDELEQRLGLAHQTCSPRVTELARQGRIVVRGTRKTRSGRMAKVWVIAKLEGSSEAGTA